MEFKRLSDVEVIAEPTESANVLIEENGVIKKAPKTAVGGAGGWDAIIDLGADTDDTECAFWEGAYSSAKFVSGGYDAIMEKLNNNELPNVLLYGIVYVYGTKYTFKVKASCVTTSSEGMSCGYTAYCFPYGGRAYITFDETNTFTNSVLWN